MTPLFPLPLFLVFLGQAAAAGDAQLAAASEARLAYMKKSVLA
jgi:hypothetical protein